MGLLGGAVAAAVAVLILRRMGNEGMAAATGVLAAVLFLSAVFLRMEVLFDQLSPLVNEQVWRFAPFLAKVLAVAWLAEISSNLCRELGSAAMGNYVELLGRVEILLLCATPVKEVIAWAVSLVS